LELLVHVPGIYRKKNELKSHQNREAATEQTELEIKRMARLLLQIRRLP
jgi:hypothetical protein